MTSVTQVVKKKFHCYLCRLGFAKTQDQRALIKQQFQSTSRTLSDIALGSGNSQANIDILGPLYHNIAGDNVKFFVLVAATGWVNEAHYIPMLDQSTKSVIRALVQLSYRVGQHFEIISSDQGSQFKPISTDYTQQEETDEHLDLKTFLLSLNPSQHATLNNFCTFKISAKNHHMGSSKSENLVKIFKRIIRSMHIFRKKVITTFFIHISF